MDAAMGIVLGACIGAVPALLGVGLKNRSDERTKIRELALTGAIEAHRIARESVSADAESQGKRVGAMPPFTDFFAHTLVVIQIAVEGKRFKPGQMTQMLSAIRAASVELTDFYRNDPLQPK
jgi:hypothetical protein